MRCALGPPASLHILKESDVTCFTEKALPWDRIVLGTAWMCPGWRGEFSSLAMAGLVRTQDKDGLWFNVWPHGVYLD